MLGFCVSLKAIEELFPFLLMVDNSGKLIFTGKSMKKLAPQLIVNANFTDHFQFLKPQMHSSAIHIESLIGRMIVIQEMKSHAKFMGQWIRPGRREQFAFIGSLSVTDPLELKGLGLDFGDFPIQDQVFDFLMLSQTQKRSIAEADQANRRLAEAHKIAVQASETKSQFLANMSHELRTPMNGVLGMASVLKEGTVLTPEQSEFVDNIIQSGESMLALINDILDLAKVESGYIQMNFETVAISDLVSELNNIIDVSAKKKGNSIEYEIAKDVPPEIRTDRLRLHQILLNIIGNANKFTKNGRILTKIRLLPGEPSKLQFSVEDNGLGMSADVQKRIFNPFIQGDSSMTKKFGGTGLGLSISKKLLNALGGDIRCESTEGLGSKFEFEIELELEDKK